MYHQQVEIFKFRLFAHQLYGRTTNNLRNGSVLVGAHQSVFAKFQLFLKPDLFFCYQDEEISLIPRL